MILNDNGIINDRSAFTDKGYILPGFDRKLMKENTLKAPEWIHFGAGNIFRAFQANLMQKLLDDKKADTGIIVCEGYDYEIIEKMYRPHDDLSILATLRSDGTCEKKVIGSLACSYILDRDNKKEFDALKSVFRAPSLKMASFTITEKGYVVKDKDGSLLDGTKADIEKGPDDASGYLGKIASLLYERYINGELPIAFVSMDNCSHNGDKLKDAMITYAKGWEDNGKCKKGFLDYCLNDKKVSFPWSMIDKITPRPDPKIEEILSADGLSDPGAIVTTKNTYVAPFVNAEETEYLVIEDSFPNGKIPLDLAGVIYTDRETVDKVERMKVCTCLNPLHTALAIFGCLLGYKTIHDEMEDEDLKALVYKLGNDEGMKVVTDPGVLDPKDFLDAVLTKRLPNPFMPDTPQRIACDTSQKLPIRFGETIKEYCKRSDLDVKDLKLIPLVIAAYLRYLDGVDDELNPMELSPDPKLSDLRSANRKDILSMKEIFGSNLYEIGIGEDILLLYEKMKDTKGAVRKELKAHV